MKNACTTQSVVCSGEKGGVEWKQWHLEPSDDHALSLGPLNHGYLATMCHCCRLADVIINTWTLCPSIITSNILFVSRFMFCVLSDKYFFLLKTNVTQGLCQWSLSITKQCPGHMCACYRRGSYSPSVLLMSTLTPILTPPITDSTSSPMALVREVSVCRYHHYHYSSHWLVSG